MYLAQIHFTWLYYSVLGATRETEKRFILEGGKHFVIRVHSILSRWLFLPSLLRQIYVSLESNKVWMNISADIIGAQKQVDMREKSKREIPKPWQFQQRGVSNRDWQIGDWKSLYAIVFVAPSSGGVSFVIMSLLFCCSLRKLPYLALPIFACALFQAQQAPYLATIAKKRLELARANNSVRAEWNRSSLTQTNCWDDDEPFRL